MAQWKRIPEFPDYVISRRGEVVNERTDRELRPSINQQGIAHLGLYKDGKLIRRSVTVLVADAFLPEHRMPHYDTPIHLDGDKANNNVDNLMWRPRWFAIEYHQQFGDLVAPSWRAMPVEVVKTGERFDSTIELCMKYGLLVREVILASMNKGAVVFELWSEVRALNLPDH